MTSFSQKYINYIITRTSKCLNSLFFYRSNMSLFLFLFILSINNIITQLGIEQRIYVIKEVHSKVIMHYDLMICIHSDIIAHCDITMDVLSNTIPSNFITHCDIIMIGHCDVILIDLDWPD